MAPHGHWKSDLRHLHLHRIALEKLRREPTLRSPCQELLGRWLADPAQASSRPWLEQWRDMLSDWPINRIAEVVLDPDGGQTLRQCSPLGPVLSPRERWAALTDVNRQIARVAG